MRHLHRWLLAGTLTLVLAPIVHAAQDGPLDRPDPPVPPAVISRDASGRATVRAVRMTTPIRIDGALNEPFYASVPPISDFIQQEPEDGAPAAQHTQVC